MMEETSSLMAKRTVTWSLGTSSLKVWGTVAAPASAQRNQQSPSLRMILMTMTTTVMVILPNLPWLTSSLLEPSTTNCASGNRMLARTHLISEASVGRRRRENRSVPPLLTCSLVHILLTIALPQQERAESPSTSPSKLSEEELAGKWGSSNKVPDFRCDFRSFL